MRKEAVAWSRFEEMRMPFRSFLALCCLLLAGTLADARTPMQSPPACKPQRTAPPPPSAEKPPAEPPSTPSTSDTLGRIELWSRILVLLVGALMGIYKGTRWLCGIRTNSA
jgi:hypothetical protein